MKDSDQFDLFSEEAASAPIGNNEKSGGEGASRPPLAARMRPRALSEVIGQNHLINEESLLCKLTRTNQLGSAIFYGPPGCGKTSLAEVIATETGSRFVRINAVQSSVAELRKVLEIARSRPGGGTLLFIDEIHRFNKSQQDLLLPDVERGAVRLIGATTHNPGFYVIAPLLSRSHLFRLEALSAEDIARVLREALLDEERGLGEQQCQEEDGVLDDLAAMCNGDLRWALNALECLVLSLPEKGKLGPEHLSRYAGERRIRYDRDEDEHYDTISAFIKSIRGGDPDAGLYWLAKMLQGGEDPRFIARRLVILSSEDVGLADSRALPLAVAAHQACDFIGLPECEYALAHAVLYLATAPKSNSACLGIHAAKKAIRENPVQAVPVPLRDKGGMASKRAGHGEGYRYSHDYPEAISGQEYLSAPLSLYSPKENGEERAIAERLARWKGMKEKVKGKSG